MYWLTLIGLFGHNAWRDFAFGYARKINTATNYSHFFFFFFFFKLSKKNIYLFFFFYGHGKFGVHGRFAIYWISRNNGPRCIGSPVYYIMTSAAVVTKVTVSVLDWLQLFLFYIYFSLSLHYFFIMLLFNPTSSYLWLSQRTEVNKNSTSYTSVVSPQKIRRKRNKRKIKKGSEARLSQYFNVHLYKAWPRLLYSSGPSCSKRR